MRKHGVSKDGPMLCGPSPSFETRESKSAVADFDTIEMPKSGRPDFGCALLRTRLIDDIDMIRAPKTRYYVLYVLLL